MSNSRVTTLQLIFFVKFYYSIDPLALNLSKLLNDFNQWNDKKPWFSINLDKLILKKKYFFKQMFFDYDRVHIKLL